jgi:6-phosphogluconate dehydrogenase
MGANMARRWLETGHACVGYARDTADAEALRSEGLTVAASLDELVGLLTPPRTVWIMVPAAAVDGVIDALGHPARPGDTLIDGGNSHFVDDVRRAAALGASGLHYLDVGVSGGIFGREQGYCLMIGGDAAVAARLTPLFASLAPGRAEAPQSGGTAAHGYLHCGQSGAGHFVKMVHNGISTASWPPMPKASTCCARRTPARAPHASTPKLRRAPCKARTEYDLDLAAIAGLWRHGSVVRSWLLDLTSAALARNPSLDGFLGEVADSGEGRWTINAAVDAGVPVPVLATALFARFSSRDHDDFANRLLSAMRREFGGHIEHPGSPRR